MGLIAIRDGANTILAVTDRDEDNVSCKNNYIKYDRVN